ncbi:MAG: YaiI/YqxD family protein [Armatimonadetes bacterium]|nr:YaiI/YqxD family protein [Armatimonadota bacterium]
MKILVDADACPVKEIIVRAAKEFRLPVIMFIDTSHVLDDGYSRVIQVDKGRESADLALVNQTEKGDIVVTQDYGLASMALSKGAVPVNENGRIYSSKNIDRLLFERFFSKKIRRAGGRTSNPPKRKKEDNQEFEKVFREICSKAKAAAEDCK